MSPLKMNDALLFQTEPVQFQAHDDYVLSGIRYIPTQTIKAKIIVASATGVPQPFYRRFAEYAAQRGYEFLLLIIAVLEPPHRNT